MSPVFTWWNLPFTKRSWKVENPPLGLVGNVLRSQSTFCDENLISSYGPYEHICKHRFIKMYTKRLGNMISINHYFQHRKGYSLKIRENIEFLNFQKSVCEKQFPAITLTWYYQFVWNLQLWYSFFNAHSMVYLRVLGYF